MPDNELSVQCCVAGGGPAGMMLGFLLARAGLDVVVLEKHPDFLRDFRGDTIHPSTLEIMHELGLLHDLLKLPHQEARILQGQFGEDAFPFADFSHLPTHCKFIAIMPQWDFLNFIAKHGARYQGFKVRMRAEVTDLIDQSGCVTGLRANTPEEPLTVRAGLVVGADGRSSVVRERAGLKIDVIGAPMDVLWFRLRRMPSDPQDMTGRFDVGQIFIRINRGDYWQCGFVIPKDSFDRIKDEGLPSFRSRIARLAPFATDRMNELENWDAVKLLSVRVDRLPAWCCPGLLCIGDAAHAMSPVGGVGINLAVQDAVAAANVIAQPLRDGRLTLDHLRAVQRRRELPTRLTQWLQVVIQNRVITPVLGAHQTDQLKLPLVARLIKRFPILRRIPARLVGLGVRPEHVKSPAA